MATKKKLTRKEKRVLHDKVKRMVGEPVGKAAKLPKELRNQSVKRNGKTGPGTGRGGRRRGSGRPKNAVGKFTLLMQANSERAMKAAIAAITQDTSPLEFLLGVMRNEEMPYSERRDAAVVCLPYCHPKLIAAVVRGIGVGGQNGGDDQTGYPSLQRIERRIIETFDSRARAEVGEGARDTGVAATRDRDAATVSRAA